MNVEDIYTRRDHDDVPDSIREQLYAEEKQRLGKQKEGRDSSKKTGSMSPLTIINNFLSAGSSQLPMPLSCAK